MSNSQLPGSATDLFNALDKKPQGGIQPPGSTNSVRRLLDAEFGGSAASIFAGEETLRSAVGTVGLWDEKSKETSRVRHDADLLARLEKGHDWVRVNLTSNELLAQLRLTLTPKTSGLAAFEMLLGDSQPAFKLAEPVATDLNRAVTAVATLQALGVPNRDEIVAQANDAGLPILRAMKLQAARHRHFLYLFDVLELVLARPLYEAKLVLDVPRPSVHSAGASIKPVVPIPVHQSFPSGHSSYAWATVSLVAGIVPLTSNQKNYLHKLADRIAINREAAGLHTDLDSAAGRQLGVAIGEWMAEAAQNQTLYPKWATLVAQAQAGWKMRHDEI